MKVLSRRRRLREAGVVLGQIRRLQERIRRGRVRDSHPPEFLHEAILMEQPFLRTNRERSRRRSPQR